MSYIDTLQTIEALKQRLKQPLPGDIVRSLLSPNINGIPQKQNKNIKCNTRKSAVLLLLWERNEQLQIVFTLRNNKLIHHGGQLSFPGGGKENNESNIQAALRETKEEIGINSNNIEIIGELTPIYILPSDNYIFPVVGFANTYLDFIINKEEVEMVITKPLNFFSFNNIEERKWEINGELFNVPFWSIHPVVPLWGATAMILAELIKIYQHLKEINC